MCSEFTREVVMKFPPAQFSIIFKSVNMLLHRTLKLAIQRPVMMLNLLMRFLTCYHTLPSPETNGNKIRTKDKNWTTTFTLLLLLFFYGKTHSSLDKVLRYWSRKGVTLLTCNVRAIPKSISFRRASTRRKLAGFKSLWMIPCWWTTWTASSICLQNPCSSPLDILLRFFRKKPARSILPHSITKIIALFSWLSSLLSKGKDTLFYWVLSI